MEVKKIREYFIMQVEFVNEIIKDIVQHNASEEILDYVVKEGYCNLNGSEDEFIRVEFGGAYAYLDIEDGKPIGSVWWNNEDLACVGCDYKRTITRLNTMTDEEILDIPEMAYIDMDNLSVPSYVPMAINKR